MENLIGFSALTGGALLHILLKGLARPTRKDRREWWQKSGRAVVISYGSLAILYGILCLIGKGPTALMALLGTTPILQNSAYLALVAIGFSCQSATKNLMSILQNLTKALQRRG
jgi:hypothetical protein